MLKKRIIPCLDIKDGRTVKGIHFESLRDAGDPLALANKYVVDGADELVFLDISATIEGRKTMVSLVRDIAKVINIPFTVGGGIESVADAKRIIDAGADKISVNSAAIKNPELITALAQTFGSQCVVLAIDTRFSQDKWEVFVQGGRLPTGLDALAWATEGVSLGAGEILLTSMNSDGSQEGFSIDITATIAANVSVPVIASGGAGDVIHFVDLFQQTKATGALAASVFHFDKIAIPELKKILQNHKIPTRL